MSETTIKFLHDWEKKQLFNVITMDQSIHNIRNKAIFYIAEYAGLRASEVGLIKLLISTSISRKSISSG